jgi:heme/copper-type cytochrome/quinol oxidase subunit 2
MSGRSRPVVWAFLVLASLLVAFAPAPSSAAIPPVHHLFQIDASQSSYAPSELHVSRGDTVTIALTSTDAVHGLYVDGYDISIQADPGQTASLTFVADRPGSFRFRCNVTCGALHPFLIGKLSVGVDSLLYRSVGITLIGALGLLLLARDRSESGILE